ncbi:MAG TPA: histidinol-phosphate transaminase [Saprospiraceae bacterium]|nr:histidinol-phosphate transaminase [Saprospiraceae bacterium]HMQ85803.1 histidinol-phosphate transaminase [Saprospiraceae bacterium]
MTQLNRRNWLKLSGLSGASLALGATLAPVEKWVQTPHPARSSGGPVRLMSNENPYGPSEVVKKAMTDALSLTYQYPFSSYSVLLEALSKHEGVPKDHILLTSGSNEGLRVAAATFGIRFGEILTCEPTYNALMAYAEEFGGTVASLPLTPELKFDLAALEAKTSPRTAMIFLCNPNNPTGTLLDAEQVSTFCNSLSDKTIVFSDEAYYDYIEQADYPSMVPLVKEGKNVIVSRTFSKVYGMAGIRVGYLIAPPDMIRQMAPKVMGYVHIMGIYGAAAALNDTTFYNYSLEMNRQSKQVIYDTCQELGLEYAPSHTNFVFLKTDRDISWVIEQMLQKGVRVGRPFPPLHQWCRVSTGTLEEMEQWRKAMKAVFA